MALSRAGRARFARSLWTSPSIAAAVFARTRIGAVTVTTIVLPSGTSPWRAVRKRATNPSATLSNRNRGLMTPVRPGARERRVMTSRATVLPPMVTTASASSAPRATVAEKRLATAWIAARSALLLNSHYLRHPYRSGRERQPCICMLHPTACFCPRGCMNILACRPE